ALELEGNRRVVDHCGDENATLRTLRGFRFHPARRYRMLGPENNDTARRVQCALDRLVKRLPRRNLSVPPHRPTLAEKCIGEQLSFIFVCSRIAYENVTHAAMMIPCGGEFNPRWRTVYV